MTVVTHKEGSSNINLTRLITPQLDRQVVISMCPSDSPTLIVLSLTCRLSLKSLVLLSSYCSLTCLRSSPSQSSHERARFSHNGKPFLLSKSLYWDIKFPV